MQRKSSLRLVDGKKPPEEVKVFAYFLTQLLWDQPFPKHLITKQNKSFPDSPRSALHTARTAICVRTMFIKLKHISKQPSHVLSHPVSVDRLVVH